MLRVALARRRVATKVVVSGGGPAGLVTALALGRAGTPCALVEPRTAPSAHPRAHVLTARTLEICEDLGLGDALRQIAPPLERWRRFRYCDRVDGADYAVADHGAAPAWANLEAASDQRVQHISQPVFEALLRRAVADADVEARYGRRVVDVGLGGDGVACVLDDGATLDAEYLVAADGPRGAAAGVVLAAATDAGDRVPGVAHHLDAPALQHFVSVAFRSRDLAARLRARPAMLYFVFNRETASVVVAHDLDEGLFNLQFPVFPPAERPGDAAAPRNVRREVRALTAAPLADLKIESARPWLMRARLADRFALDSHRAFLVGDAAHEMPPSGGFGMNTAVGDAHNLAWKLARASAGAANGRDLLASYERERRPAAAANVALSVDNWRRGLLIPEALGLPPRALDLAKVAAPTSAAFKTTTAAARAAVLARAATPHGGVTEVVAGRRELPLFFPHHDLGLRYDGASARAAAADAVEHARPGSRAYEPRLAAGERLPAAYALGPLDAGRYALAVIGAAGDLAAAAAEAAADDRLAGVLDVRPAGGAGDPALALVRPDRYVAAVWTGSDEDADALRRDLLRLTFCV